MYLTKINMPIADRGVQRALGDCQQMHRMITGLFDTSRTDSQVLYRLYCGRGVCCVYIYSSAPVKHERLLPNMELIGERDVTRWLESLSEGQSQSFDLLAWPSKKVSDGIAKNSRRRVLRTEEERLAWLARKAEQNGFELINVRELESAQQPGRHDEEHGGRMYVDSYHYQGEMRITDAAKFRAAVRSGIGPGKAYGLGMLLLKP